MDTLAYMLSSIKNASMAKKPSVELPYSAVKESVLKIIKEKGFIEGYKIFKEEGASWKMLHIDLKYTDGQSAITEVKMISKPGRRVYKTKDGLKRVIGGFGMSVVSTSQGVMEGMEARRKRLGGEVLCEVY